MPLERAPRRRRAPRSWRRWRRSRRRGPARRSRPGTSVRRAESRPPVQDSASASVSERSRSRSATTCGSSRPSSLKMRPGSASRSRRASSSIRRLGLRVAVAVGDEVQLHLAGRAQDRGLRVLEARVDGRRHLVDVALGHRRRSAARGACTRATAPARARSRGSTCSSNIGFISPGGPGSSTSVPALVLEAAGRAPCRAGSAAPRRPSITSACFRFVSDIGRP